MIEWLNWFVEPRVEMIFLFDSNTSSGTCSTKTDVNLNEFSSWLRHLWVFSFLGYCVDIIVRVSSRIKINLFSQFDPKFRSQ